MSAKKTTSEHYRPQNKPTRYPLELAQNLHIDLWAEDGSHKWSVAYFQDTKEGPELHFVGARPFDERVRWKHFGELARQGQTLAEKRWRKKVKRKEW